jgi:hypothetical protein
MNDHEEFREATRCAAQHWNPEVRAGAVQAQALFKDYDAMDDALGRIIQWSDAYPLEVFPELSREDWARVAEVLKAAGLSLDRVSASNMRHVITRVGDIARTAVTSSAGVGLTLTELLSKEGP